MKIKIVFYSMYGHIYRMAESIADVDNSRFPSENELAMAHFQGHHVATIAKKLSAT